MKSDVINKLTIDQVKAIEKKQNRHWGVGMLFIAFGISIGLVRLSGILGDSIIWPLVLVTCMVIGGVVMLFAPTAYECKRCGYYYIAKWRHPKNECLCNQKTNYQNRL